MILAFKLLLCVASLSDLSQTHTRYYWNLSQVFMKVHLTRQHTQWAKHTKKEDIKQRWKLKLWQQNQVLTTHRQEPPSRSSQIYEMLLKSSRRRALRKDISDEKGRSREVAENEREEITFSSLWEFALNLTTWSSDYSQHDVIYFFILSHPFVERRRERWRVYMLR